MSSVHTLYLLPLNPTPMIKGAQSGKEGMRRHTRPLIKRFVILASARAIHRRSELGRIPIAIGTASKEVHLSMKFACSRVVK